MAEVFEGSSPVEEPGTLEDIEDIEDIEVQHTAAADMEIADMPEELVEDMLA